MHSHDRTLLSKLGFADPDKKDRRHDLACQYLSQNERPLQLYAMALAGKEGYQGTLGCERVVLESMLTKGEGQYAVTIGFIDLWIYGSIRRKHDDGECYQSDAGVIVEVKILPVGVGDIIRQLKLYRAHAGRYVSGIGMVVVTAFDLTDTDVEALRSVGIRYAGLGEAFYEWCERQKDAAPAKPALML